MFRKVFLLAAVLLALHDRRVFSYDEEGMGGGGYGGEDGPPGGGYGGGPPGGGYGGGGGGNAPKELTSSEEIASFVAEADELAAVVGYFDPSNESDKQTFMSIASTHGSTYKFAYTTEKSVLEEHKYDGSTVLVHKPPKFLSVKAGEKPRARYPSKVRFPHKLGHRPTHLFYIILLSIHYSYILTISPNKTFPPSHTHRPSRRTH